MEKYYLKEVVKSPAFLVPAIIVGVGVTVLYGYKFFSSDYSQTNLLDTVIYWLIYAVVFVFLQFVLFVNAKRQILSEREIKIRKR